MMPAALRPWIRRLRLGGKLQLIIAAGFLLAMTSLLAFQTAQRVSDTYTARRKANHHLTQDLAGPLASAMPTRDSQAVYGYMEVLDRQNTAAAVVIVNAGHVVKSQQSLDYMDLPIETLQSVALKAQSGHKDCVTDRGEFEYIGVPVVDSAGRVIGAFGIAWSMQDLHETILRAALAQTAFIGLACAVLLWLISCMVRHVVTDPLRIIADAIEIDSTAERQHLPKHLIDGYARREDEIGSLARAFQRFQLRAVELKELNTNFDAALMNMTQGLCLFDAQQRLLVHNPCFTRMFGAPAIGATAITLSADEQLGKLFHPPTFRELGEADIQVIELADGREIQRSHQATPNGGWVATYEDTTERRRSHERLSYMARHDALTALPNRLLLREHIDSVLHYLHRGKKIALLYLDLDGFKGVNDTLGHPVGDELLRTVGRCLRDNTGKTDFVARLGGDEFAIIQVDGEQPGEATALADRLVAALSVPFDIMGHQIRIGASIGVVLADATEAAPDELLRSADIALYRAKASGRNTWRLFETQMDHEIRQRHLLEAELRRALIEEQFELFYQPLIRVPARELIGFEALLRWRHPQRGLLAPAMFITLAEECGLIKEIGAWVVVKACADAAAWPKHLQVSVNLSPVQFLNGNLLNEVEGALALSKLSAHRLELEITESVMLLENQATLHTLNQLHDLGVRISMDDFGTGYSSVSYLRQFPFDKIKIDQSFVRKLGEKKGSVAIVRAMVGLGKALGMAVLAEGVETEEQCNILQDEGCDELQGYLFGKPHPVQGVQEMVDRFPAALPEQERRLEVARA